MNEIYARHLKMTVGCVMGAALFVGMWAYVFAPGIIRNEPKRPALKLVK